MESIRRFLQDETALSPEYSALIIYSAIGILLMVTGLDSFLTSLSEQTRMGALTNMMVSSLP